jgi:hypothetical protein
MKKNCKKIHIPKKNIDNNFETFGVAKTSSTM